MGGPPWPPLFTIPDVSVAKEGRPRRAAHTGRRSLRHRLACDQRVRSSDYAHETSQLLEVLAARFRFDAAADIDRRRSDVSDRLPHVLGIETARENDPRQALRF